MSGPVTVRETLPHLTKWGAQVIAGESGCDRWVRWATVMRAQLPAFQDARRDELAVLSVATVRALQNLGAPVSLVSVLDLLFDLGAAGVVIAGLAPLGALPKPLAVMVKELRIRADREGFPVIALPQQAPLNDVRDAIVGLVQQRSERLTSPLEPVDAYAAQMRASLRSEALEAMLAGAYIGEAQMRMRASHLGYDLAKPYAALWLQLGPLRRSSRRDGPTDQQLARRIAEEFTLALGAWAHAREPDQVVALLPSLSPRETHELVERVQSIVESQLGAPGDRKSLEWSAGLGDPAIGPAQARRSAQEARDAALLGAIALGPRHIARPGDLGVYRLLLTLRDQGELEPFTERTLEPLLRDRRLGDTLVETLDAFFACNGNSTKAAERLHLHRNSLLYRLNQARDLLGQDLDDPEVRLTLQLAIKGRRVLQLSEERQVYER